VTDHRPENSDGRVTPFRAQQPVNRRGRHWYVVDWRSAPVTDCGWGERGKAIATRFAILWNRSEGIPNSVLTEDRSYR
jgi:hypothetical protein